MFLEISRGVVISGNRTAARIWSGIQRGDDLDRLAADIAGEMSSPVEIIRADIDAFIGDLQKHKLVTVTNP